MFHLYYFRFITPRKLHKRQWRESIFKHEGGGEGEGAHLPLSHTHALTQIFQNALCVVL